MIRRPEPDAMHQVAVTHAILAEAYAQLAAKSTNSWTESSGPHE